VRGQRAPVPTAGGPRLKREWLAIDELIGAALAQLHGALGRRLVRIDLAPDPPLFPGDETLIGQLLVNLVENAIKHTLRIQRHRNRRACRCRLAARRSAHAIVQAHGGSIEVRNRDGGGAEFAFTLPLQRAEQPGED
jgi:two-component system sensor histidine kinase KdpD